MDAQVIVIGAGIAGLTAAWQLQKYGIDPRPTAENGAIGWIRCVFLHRNPQN